jgi:hypothetical protein
MPLKKSKILLTHCMRNTAEKTQTFLIDKKRKVAEKSQTLYTDSKRIAAETSLASFTYPQFSAMPLRSLKLYSVLLTQSNY